MKRIFMTAVFLFPMVVFADGPGSIELESYANSDGTGVHAKRGRNDFTIKEPVTTSDKLFFIKAYGYNGSGFPTTPRAQISMNAMQTWSTTANGADISFSVTPNDSTTMAEAVRISTNGYVGIGTTNPSSTLEVNGYFRNYNRTSAQIKVTTPTAVGLQVFDTTLNQPVWSTGTSTCFDWVNSTGTRPAGY